jgi:hypothetical protein
MMSTTDPWCLALAVERMAARYGAACLDFGLAERGSREEDAARRAMYRRFRALCRLTAGALEEHQQATRPLRVAALFEEPRAEAAVAGVELTPVSWGRTPVGGAT